MESYQPLSSAGTLEEKRQQVLEQCDRLIKDFAKRADRLKEVEVAAFITTKVCVQIDSMGLHWFVLQRGLLRPSGTDMTAFRLYDSAIWG